jgi:hypothetical protein
MQAINYSTVNTLVKGRTSVLTTLTIHQRKSTCEPDIFMATVAYAQNVQYTELK